MMDRLILQRSARPSYNCNAGANPGGPFNYICGTIPNQSVIPLGSNTNLTNFLPVINSLNIGTAATPITRLLQDQYRQTAGLSRHVEHGHATAQYDAGFLTFNVLGGYNRTTYIYLNDLDNEDSRAFPNPIPVGARGPLAPSFNNTLVRREGYSEDWFGEFRVSTDATKPLHGFLGVSYAHALNATFVTVQLITGNSIPAGLGAINRNRTPAVFGNLTWDVSSKISVSAEGRYQVDMVDSFRRSQFTSTDGPVLVNGVMQSPLIAAAEFKNFTPRVIVQYKPTSNTMIYASYSEGVNPGTFNTSVLAFSADFQARLAAATGAGLVVQRKSLRTLKLA